MHPIPYCRPPLTPGVGVQGRNHVLRTFRPSKYITMPNFTQIGETVWISIRYFLFCLERNANSEFCSTDMFWVEASLLHGSEREICSIVTLQKGTGILFNRHVMSWGLFFTRIGTGNLFNRLLLLLKGSLYSKQISRSVPCNKEVLTFYQTNPFLSV